MKKKYLLFGFIACLSASVLAGHILSRGQKIQALRIKAGEPGEYAYDHIFDNTMVGYNATAALGSSKDTEQYGVDQAFSLTGKTALKTNDLATTPYAFEDGQYYLNGSFIRDTDGDGATIEIVNGMVSATCKANGKYFEFQVMYTFFEGVAFDDSSSYVTYEKYNSDTKVTTYGTAYFYEWESNTNKYYASFNNYDFRIENSYIRIQKVHFEYLCE